MSERKPDRLGAGTPSGGTANSRDAASLIPTSPQFKLHNSEDWSHAQALKAKRKAAIKAGRRKARTLLVRHGYVAKRGIF